MLGLAILFGILSIMVTRSKSNLRHQPLKEDGSFRWVKLVNKSIHCIPYFLKCCTKMGILCHRFVNTRETEGSGMNQMSGNNIYNISNGRSDFVTATRPGEYQALLLSSSGEELS